MSLCLLASGKVTVIAASAFTLAWTHSVERTAWEEDWKLTSRGLEIVEARVKGSGAGMDPPEGAVLSEGWWHYKPPLAPVKELHLATSGATAPWRLCTTNGCLKISPDPEMEAATLGRCTDRAD